MCTKTYKKSNASLDVEIPFFKAKKREKERKSTKTGNSLFLIIYQIKMQFLDWQLLIFVRISHRNIFVQ